MRALISLYDKAGVDELARGLHELGWELVASGGTAAHLEALGLPVIPVEALTGLGELLGHRVVTLHPAVHAGILARRDVPGDLEELAGHGIEPFDLVVVDLYPFEQAARSGASEQEVVELIDVGGPALLRAAAKNAAWVAAVARRERWSEVLAELRTRGALSAETRRRLAAEAFAVTAAYDAQVARWLAGDEVLPERLTLAVRKELDLAYGENPHQRAAYYAEPGTPHLLDGVEQLGGRELSYNNLHDLAAARRLLAELEGPACVIVKHANPCGVAVAGSVEEAYRRALAADPVSAFGGIVALDRPVSAALAGRLAEQFVEVLVAPGYEAGALETLRRREALRLLAAESPAPPGRRELRAVLGGLLVQEPDTAVEGREAMTLVCGDLDEAAWADLVFAWRVCKHVCSNAIVLAKGLQTIGIGAGQTSRVDAVRLALEKARALGHDPRGAALASDAFFPFADGPELALAAGVSAIAQPGGSKRDAEVVAAVEAAGAAMAFTARRHFRH